MEGGREGGTYFPTSLSAVVPGELLQSVQYQQHKHKIDLCQVICGTSCNTLEDLVVARDRC